MFSFDFITSVSTDPVLLQLYIFLSIFTSSVTAVAINCGACKIISAKDYIKDYNYINQKT